MLKAVLNRKIAAQFAKLQPEVLAEVKRQIPIAAKKAQISIPFLRLVVASLINERRDNGKPKEDAAALIEMAVDKLATIQIAIMHGIK